MIPTREELIERLGGEYAADALLDQFSNPDLEAYRPVLSALIEQGVWDLLADSFYQVMPFGTGGRRGPVGLGPNRFNPHNLATSVQGHVEYMRDLFGSDEISVVVAFDVREFQDLRELYPRGVSNPLLGWRSRDFARLAAEVYAANGVRVHMLDPEGEAFMSTPELSFAIRQFGASGGLNVSASHNHPDDNGGKFYNVHGGQEVPPQDERMVSIVEGVQSYRRMAFDEAVAAGRVILMGPAMHRQYLDLNLAFARHPDLRDLRIVFSNLHGVGDQTAGEILSEAGFEVHMVPSQLAHDGSFPGAPFNAPNPEYPAALEAAEEVARACDADLVLAADPDADRIGGLSHEPDGSWRFLTGNELTCLVVDFLLRGRPGRSFVITTEVTTGLFGRIARGHGAEVVDHLLVGCKYIAEIVRELEEDGRIGEFVMGCEESHGFLLSPHVRDKDSGGVALVLAEMAALEKARGSSLGQRLGRIYKEFGPVCNAQVPLVMQGASGKRKIEAIQAALRKAPPTDVGGSPVTAFHDRQDPEGVFGPIVSTTDAAARNVLVFHLGERERVIIRPSGTEPKTKIYLEVIGEPLGVDASDEALDRANAAVQARAAELARAMTATALERVGIELPAYAFAMSPLVSIEHRQDFCDVFLPQLRRRVSAGEEVSSWIDGHLRPYGKDARELVRGAVEVWLETVREGDGNLADSIARVF